ncbi:MAG: transketolase family protein [Clostridia bacterium]|nr:transketolase family protein [Clostridia bacterium]
MMNATRESYGNALANLGKKYKNVVVLDADLAEATKTIEFKKKFPKRFFDIGIAEQDMMGTAAGLALEGKIPFASTFAIFAAGRAYEQIRNTIAYSNLNVKVAATHAGLTVGEDGASHQSIEDLALMRVIPGMTIISPCDDLETKWAVEEAIKLNGPVYIRLTRPKVSDVYTTKPKFELGKAIVHGDGKDATVIATGLMVQEALKAKEILEKENINIRVIDIHTIKPIDEDAIIKAAKETNKIITIEDHSIIGGLGSAVCEVLSENYPTKIFRMGVKDEFGQSGKWNELLEHYGLTCDEIVKEVKK